MLIHQLLALVVPGRKALLTEVIDPPPIGIRSIDTRLYSLNAHGLAHARGHMVCGVHGPGGATGVGGVGGVNQGEFVKSKKLSRSGCAASRFVRCAPELMKRFSTNFMIAVWSMGTWET